MAETFSKEERAAMREAAKERKANLSLEQAAAEVQAKIEAMSPADKKLAKKVHEIVTKAAPELNPKTWYGMQAYFKDGKVVCFFQDGGKFKSRYSTLGFQDAANLDEGTFWATSYAVIEITPEVEKEITDLVKKAAS
ncbi:MAG: hypothetical protein K9G13_06770 [Aquiluna sp.]|nr:hypothetical protein [Aquiluna sp.]MCF8546220.1 hypothetical protein [Aquiluna sp.]